MTFLFQKLHNVFKRREKGGFSEMLLTLVLVLVSVSLFETVLSWILLLLACATTIRVAIYFNFHKHLPTIRTLNLLAALSALGLIYSGLSLDMLIAMVNLLILACTLKLMQVRSQKDIYQLVISLFFLVGCGFIFNQSIGHSIFYSGLSLTLLLSLACHHAPRLKLKAQIRTISILSLQALPIGLLLFLVLPQLPPLWQTPKSKSMETGLAEQLTPGDIANLSQSSELAFRATFEASAPSMADRYWRAIVMEDFDGKTWKIHDHRKQIRRKNQLFGLELSPVLFGSYIDYEVITEPTQQNWLYALDVATPLGIKSNGEIFQSGDFQLISQQKIVSQYQYQVRSYPNAMPKQLLSGHDKPLNLSLPQGTNPLTRKWVKGLQSQYPKQEDFAQAVLSHFTKNPFIYTLRPEVMYTDPIDQFLFDKQAGFCSHYASALAFSLRLGGVPARVVAGYQGGELIQEKNSAAYLSIYQYDAHAWVEAWRENIGWQRIDPTALVSPDRINFGLRQAMLEEGSFLADSPFALARLIDIAWLNNIRLFLADVDYNWSRWVLGFNSQSQQDLFKSILGKLTPDRLSLLGLGICLVIGLLLALFFIPHWLDNRLNKTQQYYLDAIKLFEKHNVSRSMWQGPQGFADYVSECYPNKVADTFTTFSKLYIRLNYQGISAHPNSQLTTKACHKMMRQLLRQLKADLATTSA